MNLSVYVASAFSKNHTGGNKAGVVLNQPTLTTPQKMAIAKQLGYAETVFISASEVADYKLAYFTPKEEVDLCGHATIGAFAILKHLNQLGRQRYTVETNSGVLPITLQDDLIFMAQNQPTLHEVLSPNVLSACFDSQAIDLQYPIQIVSTGLKDILIPIKSDAQLHALQPNFEHIKTISQQYNAIGMHLYAFDGDRIICRNFAPLYDIDEEAATGTANAALASYLYQQHHLYKDLYVFEQGYALRSPSEILVRLSTNDQNDIEQVYVGGQGHYCETKGVDVKNLSV